MAYVFLVLLVILVVGLCLRFAVGMRRPPAVPADEDTTDRDVIPPAHPDDPIPGSATRRQDQGKP